MARMIKCDRCGDETDKDYTSIECDVPPYGTINKAVRVTALIVNCNEGDQIADLCRACTHEAAKEVIKQLVGGA